MYFNFPVILLKKRLIRGVFQHRGKKKRKERGERNLPISELI